MNASPPPCPRKRKKRRIGPPLPAPALSSLLLVRVAPAKVGMFRFLLEGYDNLAYFTVLERHSALLKIVFSPHRDAFVREALTQIASTLPLEIQEWPG